MANRKDKRQQRQVDHDAAYPSPPATPPALLAAPEPPPVAAPAMYAKSVPLLICSIGNPGPTYTNTLHSAGHTLLAAVWELAQHASDHTPFARERSWGNGLVSFPISGGSLGWTGVVRGKSLPEGASYTGKESQQEMWTWWLSAGFMNVSGKGLAEARKRWRGALAAASYPPDLLHAAQVVVLHDELEKPVGKYIVRKERSSLKGHNGLKSVEACLRGQPFIRIGVGIDRPLSRDPTDVSRHVLRKMTEKEQSSITGMAPAVLEELRDIAEGK